ncbi:coronin-2B-like isoform X1 [Boleophthalmus pectinirostris]|uniref:coronin-2B-like isoform X1 n=1 Tax=Boleophthalmus pectinirostris TaxID=150288 RepID=UPI00242B3F89|nr:coronin-2B-like isoform X1 [Boleophthalmus pectinirostris]XP_055012109.1 coronin-2B-like isoform X1 [Boleophthalmus pectinirostris]
MSARSSFRGSKFRHVFAKPASREHSFDGLPITRGVHDTHCCAVNPAFIAVVTECSGGGAFLVLPVTHTGRVDPLHPRVCGHRAQVLDVKWNPFDDHCIASCSEDCTVKVWDIPVSGVQKDLTWATKTLMGHSRRVAIIEWHPTAENLLLSSAYDYKVLLWDLSQPGSVLRSPVRVVMMPFLYRCPSEALLLSVSFSRDGSSLAVTSKDRRIRILDPRMGKILQVSSRGPHRASKVLFINDKMLLSTGCSPWNQRQIVLWDPEDLSEPLYEEDLDGAAGVLFPFYDPDTNMLYLAGKVGPSGDGNIRYYELSGEKPFLRFLTEFRSLLPQRGLGVMPKRGLNIKTCEVYRFYRLICVKDLVEPVSMIVPRKEPGIFHEDLYPPTAGNQAAMTAQEWLAGVNRGPILMSLKPGTRVTNPYPESAPERGLNRLPSSHWIHLEPDLNALTRDMDFMEEAFYEEQLSYQDLKFSHEVNDLSGWTVDETFLPLWPYCCTPHCCEPTERPPPNTESELLQAFYKQQEEIRELREQLNQKEERISQLEIEIKVTRNSMRASF